MAGALSALWHKSIAHMFFFLSKTVWFFLQPTSFLIILIVAGVVLLRKGSLKAGKWALGIGLTGLVAAAVSPLGNWLILPLEERFLQPDPAAISKPAGIIVLGGSLDPLIAKSRGVLAVNESAERLIVGSALARKYSNAKFVFTGGSAAILLPKSPEAVGVRDILLRALGLSKHRLIVEDRSRNTFENAIFTRKLLRPRRHEKWILVTSAYHMPRAAGCFRKVGFDIIPWPVDYRTRGREDLLLFFAQPSGGLRRVDEAMREWVGLLVYWITGRTNNLFPWPMPIQ